MKIQNEDQVAARLESALYSAGRPLTVEELIKASGTESRQKTLAVLDSIIKKMNSICNAKKLRNHFNEKLIDEVVNLVEKPNVIYEKLMKFI